MRVRKPRTFARDSTRISTRIGFLGSASCKMGNINHIPQAMPTQHHYDKHTSRTKYPGRALAETRIPPSRLATPCNHSLNVYDLLLDSVLC